MKLLGQQIIASSFVSSGKSRFCAVNPVDGDALEPPFTEATFEEIDHAVAEAESSFDDYRSIPSEQKALFLENIGEQLLAASEDLITRANSETALPPQRLEGELMRTVNQLRLFADHLRKGAFVGARFDAAVPERKPLPKPDIRTMNIPLGPVAIFGASNFPLAFSVAGGDTASALAAGCPVVVKGHPSHPGTSELAGLAIMDAVKKSDLPPGVFSLLHAQNNDVGKALAQHPGIKAIAFTGSHSAGRALFDLACTRPEPIPVYAEMGSVNPVFLLPGVVATQKEGLVEGLATSLTVGVGQFCTAPGLIFMVKGKMTDDFVAALSDRLDSVSEETMLNEGIKSHFEERVRALCSSFGVEQCSSSNPIQKGCNVQPVLFKVDYENYRENPHLTEEVFGPASIIVACQSLEEIKAAADDLVGQLTASVHGEDGELADNCDLLGVLERKAGRIIINGFPTGVEVCPAMHHGGPYPATTDSRSTSVGTGAVQRFLKPVCYQNFPLELLPGALQQKN